LTFATLFNIVLIIMTTVKKISLRCIAAASIIETYLDGYFREEEGIVDDEVMLMMWLLRESGCFQEVFSRGESRQRSMEKIKESYYVSIGELVRLTGSRYSTLKFYTEEGMLPFMQEGEKLTRKFPREETCKRIEEINFLESKDIALVKLKSF